LYLLAAGGALSAMAIGTLSGFLLVSLVDEGLSEGSAGLVVALASVASIVVRLMGGRFVDRHETSGIPQAALLMFAGAVGFGLLAAGQSSLLVPGACLAYGLGWAWGGLFHHAVMAMPPQAPGRATGVTVVGTAFGAAVGPLGAGFLARSVGFGAVWGIASVLMIAAGLMMLTAERVHVRSRGQSGTGRAWSLGAT
jgi:MFS family permease